MYSTRDLTRLNLVPVEDQTRHDNVNKSGVNGRGPIVLLTVALVALYTQHYNECTVTSNLMLFTVHLL